MYDRSKTIGASDAVHIAAGDWAALYDRKTSSDAPSYSLPARIGKACEALNREWFTQETGIPVIYDEIWDKGTPVTHPDYEWMKYLPDGLVDSDPAKLLEHPPSFEIPWEGKAINGMWRPHLLIKKYTPQLLHQMRVMDAPFAYLSVLYLNTRWEFYQVEWDEPAADALLEKELAFLWHLQKGIRPPEYKGKRVGWIE